MEYRRLGRAGIKVSAVSIGGWITFGGSLDEATSHAIVRESIEQGINFIDLADVYARGKAETVAGRVLKDYRRSDLIISSKCFWPMSDNINDRGLSRKHIIESVEGSLQRLGTDYLDIQFCHRADPETPMDETVRAMEDLIRQGKILYWGTSVWEAQQLEEAHLVAEQCNAYAPTVEQPRYSLLDRHIEEAILPMADRLGMGLVVWSPLAQGMLTGKYDAGVPEGSRAATTDWLKEHMTEENLERSRRFSALARELGYEPGQVALAWLLKNPVLSSVITGATSAEHVRSNVKALEVQLDDAAMAKIEGVFA